MDLESALLIELCCEKFVDIFYYYENLLQGKERNI